MDALIAAHSGVRWVVIVALTVAGGYALWQAHEDATFDDRPYVITAGIVDLQAAIGIVLYLGGQAWNDTFFIAVIHPVLMLSAVASVHIGLVRARRETGRRALRIVGTACLFPLLLLAVGIPW